MTTSRVYISYSYDSDDHVREVRQFASRLKADGIDAHIDADVDLDPPEGWPTFSQRQIEDADYVILVCTETYRRRFDGREEIGRGRGASFEGKLIRQEIFDSQGRTRKFVPVILTRDDFPHIPSLLRDRSTYVISTQTMPTAGTSALDYESLLRRLQTESSKPATTRSPKLQKEGPRPMATQHFNARRLTELEELLDLEYEKYHEFEKEISLSDGAARITLKQRFKRDVAPRLRQLEQEYAETLIASVPTSEIPEPAAEAIVAELSQTTGKILESVPADAPKEMLRLLGDIRNSLAGSKEPASAKLKFSLPIIPAICSYEMEVETAGLMKKVWRKGRDFFKGLIPNHPN